MAKRKSGPPHTLSIGYRPKAKADWWQADSPAARYLEAIELGMTLRLAAASAGLSAHTVARWKAAARDYPTDTAELDDQQRMIARFSRWSTPPNCA